MMKKLGADKIVGVDISSGKLISLPEELGSESHKFRKTIFFLG
jgi:hypothetical protein